MAGFYLLLIYLPISFIYFFSSWFSDTARFLRKDKSLMIKKQEILILKDFCQNNFLVELVEIFQLLCYTKVIIY